MSTNKNIIKFKSKIKISPLIIVYPSRYEKHDNDKNIYSSLDMTRKNGK